MDTPKPAMTDEALELLGDYAASYLPDSEEAYETAYHTFLDALGCGILALSFPACTKLLGPVVAGTIVPGGSRVPGTPYILDPIRAAFNIGTMIRWLDYNDTWLASEWGHPSDNLGGLLAVGDYLNQQGTRFTVRDLLTAMIKAYEIQGSLALENSFNQIGFDHVIFVKVATTAIVTQMLGGSRNQIIDALSNAWIDAGPLRTYRHAPNTGTRKSWAAGDATSRGVMFATMGMQGEMGYPTALSAKRWGLYDVLFHGRPFKFQQPLGSYVMENILFKISFPAEFHAQTAVECAFKLHPEVKGRWDEIDRISISTHEAALQIIDKTGPLTNPADRDHCLQYMVAIGLLYGKLTADHYEENAAKDPRIDALRHKMILIENPSYSMDYLDPNKRSIANAITIHWKEGSTLGPVEVKYPLGHRRRRQESLPFLFKKFEQNLSSHYDAKQSNDLAHLFLDRRRLEEMALSDLLQQL